MATWPNDPPDRRARTMKQKVVAPPDAGPTRRRRRRSAEPEPWDDGAEPFEGASVLEDLDRAAGDAREAAVVVARYVVVRAVLRSEAGVSDWRLFEECGAAAAYLEGSHGLGAEERAALTAVLRGVSGRKEPGLATALVDAGGHAMRRGHLAGARSLFLAAYAVAMARGWAAGASRAAEAVAGLARATGARRAERRWRRRAAALARRAARHAERNGSGGR
ncbi:MAG TPA: hypothetical protein VF212_05765 [Longimicrobiales bacterium]